MKKFFHNATNKDPSVEYIEKENRLIFESTFDSDDPFRFMDPYFDVVETLLKERKALKIEFRFDFINSGCMTALNDFFTHINAVAKDPESGAPDLSKNVDIKWISNMDIETTTVGDAEKKFRADAKKYGFKFDPPENDE